MRVVIVLYIISAVLYIGMPVRHLLKPVAFSNKADLLYFLPVLLLAMALHVRAMDKKFEEMEGDENE